MKHLRRLGLAGWLGRSLLAVVVLLSVSGYLVTSRTVDGDRQSAAERSALVTSVRTQGVLGRLRAAVVALGGELADEPRPDQRRFAQVANSTAGSVGLVDTMWVQRTSTSKLVATFTSRLLPDLRPGTDVSDSPVLAGAVGPSAALAAVTASDVGSLGSRPGLYLLEAAKFGDGPDGQGVLVAFVPRGLLTVDLGFDPQRLEIGVNGRNLEGGLDSAPAAEKSFEALGRTQARRTLLFAMREQRRHLARAGVIAKLVDRGPSQAR